MATADTAGYLDKDTDAWLDVFVFDANGNGVTGLAAASFSAATFFRKASNTEVVDTAVTLVDTGDADYEINEVGGGWYSVNIPGASGATANNDTSGLVWIMLERASGPDSVGVPMIVIDPTNADNLATLATDALADSVPADGSLPTVRQSLYMITQFLMERAKSGTTLTVKKVNGSTTLMTFTLDDADAPTSITRTT